MAGRSESQVWKGHAGAGIFGKTVFVGGPNGEGVKEAAIQFEKDATAASTQTALVVVGLEGHDGAVPTGGVITLTSTTDGVRKAITHNVAFTHLSLVPFTASTARWSAWAVGYSTKW